MASIKDAFTDAFNDRLSYLKFVIYSLPLYYCVYLYSNNDMGMFYFCSSVTVILYFALLTQGIHLVRMSSVSILSLNPFDLLTALVKGIAAITPQLVVSLIVYNFVATNIKIPIDIPNIPVQDIFLYTIMTILASYVITSYLSFAKYLRIQDAYNVKIISQSFVDVFIALLFFVPQIALANLIIVGPVAYLYFFFKMSYNHWFFIYYCTFAAVINLSIMANYLAQVSYEQIKSTANEDFENQMDNKFKNEEILSKSSNVNNNIPNSSGLPRGSSFPGSRDFNTQNSMPQPVAKPEESPFKRLSAKDDERIPNVVQKSRGLNNLPSIKSSSQKIEKEQHISDAQKFDKLNSEIQQKFSAMGGGSNFSVDAGDAEDDNDNDNNDDKLD